MPRNILPAVAILLVGLFVCTPVFGQAVDLPHAAPRPLPAARGGAAPTVPDTAPLPEPRPAVPAEAGRGKGAGGKADGESHAKPVDLPAGPDERDVRPAQMPAAERACRLRLASLGVIFDERPPESDPAGCAIAYPIVIRSLGRSITIEPEAELNCAMAEAAARFVTDVVSPEAEKAFGQRLKSVGHASAYVCRPRNGTNKLSEHAFGNALDIARFVLADGKPVDVLPINAGKEAGFFARIRKAACGPFKTVLGPGSDADHALHLHFDLASRRNGGTFCQ